MKEEDACLSNGVASVPQGISQVLASARAGVDHFEGNARDAESLGRLLFPVGLRDLLPHHHVEAATRLVAEHEAGVVIVPVSVHVHRATEIHSAELIETLEEEKRGVQGWLLEQ